MAKKKLNSAHSTSSTHSTNSISTKSSKSTHSTNSISTKSSKSTNSTKSTIQLTNTPSSTKKGSSIKIQSKSPRGTEINPENPNQPSENVELVLDLPANDSLSPKTLYNREIITVDHLTVSFDDFQAVREMSFSIVEGEITGFLGISGAGKTTIVKVLTCQISSKQWQGTVRICGLDPAKGKNQKEILSKIGYVPQLEEANLYYNLTPFENVDIFAANYGISAVQSKKIASELFQILDLPEHTFNQPVAIMSGGEKKRLSMALGLINKPDLLFLDEPTTGVDASKRYQILSYLKRLNERLHTTMILITHDLEAAHICDSLLLLKDGVLIEQGAPNALIKTLPSKGETIRLRLDNINEYVLKLIEQQPYVRIIAQIAINSLDIFLDAIETNTYPLIETLIANKIKILEFSKNMTTFRLYFQIRITQEKRNEYNAGKVLDLSALG